VLFPGQEEVIREIAAVHPELEAELTEHREYHEDVLPILWMADVERWAASRLRVGDLEPVERLLKVLERLYVEGGEGEELVYLGFVEAMDGPAEPAAGLRSMLGPRMAEGYDAIWSGTRSEESLT